MLNSTRILSRRQPSTSKIVISIDEEKKYLFFIGFPCFTFNTFAPLILSASSTKVTAVISDTYGKDYSHVPISGVEVPIVTMAEFYSISKHAAVEVVQFFERRDDLWSFVALKSSGINVKIVDFIEKLAELKLHHTYRAVNEERDWWLSQPLERVQRMSDMLGDQRSKDVLAARISAYVNLDRNSLMENSMSMHYEYFNNIDGQQSFTPSDCEWYVDVGAAHGDTIDKFISVVNGKFSRIDAFEPTPGQYVELEKRAFKDHRIHTYQSAVGGITGEIKFFDDLKNPFGGNAVSIDDGQMTIDVKCVRLDDVINKCTLLKMDVEGFECRVLEGARQLIRTNKPNMAVTCYHYPNDLFDILELVADIHSYRYVALRHYGATLYDSILYFSDRKSVV